MKSSFLIIIILFILFIEFFTSINAKKSSKSQKAEQPKEKEEENALEEKDDEEKETKEKEGHMMTEDEFEEKLKAILLEKHIRKNTKITKDKLKEIFEAIYEKDFILPDLPED